MKHNLARAKMALPNGYCGLPLQKSCPHANACVRCSLLRPDPAQRARLEEIRDNLESRIIEAKRAGSAKSKGFRSATAASKTS
jgi:hypothetical protein